MADVVIDCAPGKMGAGNIAKYKAAGVKHIFQGGEKHDLTGLSYTSCANHDANLNAEGTRVVSCNTTGLFQTLGASLRALRLAKGGMHHDTTCSRSRRLKEKVQSTLSKPVLKVPSHVAQML